MRRGLRLEMITFGELPSLKKNNFELQKNKKVSESLKLKLNFEIKMCKAGQLGQLTFLEPIGRRLDEALKFYWALFFVICADQLVQCYKTYLTLKKYKIFLQSLIYSCLVFKINSEQVCIKI